MSVMSKYELTMLEQRRKEEEFKKTKSKVSIITGIIIVVGIIAIVGLLLKDKVNASIDTIDDSLTPDTPTSKG